MIKLKQAVIVEGKYDRIKLSSIIDACIIETGGFKIFSDSETISLIQLLAKKTGIIIMTDSDFAGFKIRNYLCKKINDGEVFNAFLPDVKGKEKRKTKPSKEGILGVEGFGENEILVSLKNAGVTDSKNCNAPEEKITRLDIYLAGLNGTKDSSKKRHDFLRSINLPVHLSATVLPDVLSRLISKEEFYKLTKEL